jgi:HSP20 family protein
MKNLILRNSYTPMKSILDMFNDDFFNDSFLSKSVPSVNVKENNSEFLIEVAAPGYKKDSFNIEIQDNYLKISSKNESKKEDKSDKWHRQEFSYSSFERSFSLPEDVNAEDIKATYNEGILNISIPKKVKVEKTSRVIEIQ